MRKVVFSYPFIIGAVVVALLGGLVVGSLSLSQLRGNTQPAATPAQSPTGAAPALAPTTQVIGSQAPSRIVQFPIYPFAIKSAYPDASGVVTITEGYPGVSAFDTVTVDVYKMPANTSFTVFLTELANPPIGHFEYVGDLYTRDDGSGEATFHARALGAFTGDARNPGVYQGLNGAASGYQLEHLGMWFGSLQDAQNTLHDSTLKGTPFAPGSPPLHAGPLAMTDGQTSPVF
jgi:hypothetical protein